MVYVPSVETRKKHSDVMKKRWAKGAYANLWTEERRQKLSVKMKSRVDKGTMLVPSQRYAITQDPKLKHVGKGPDHYHSKYWEFKSPDGVIIKGLNLSELVRQNAHLFLPEDVVWRGKTMNQCRALTGLSQLKLLKPDGSYRRNSWKGWVFVECKDRSK